MILAAAALSRLRITCCACGGQSAGCLPAPHQYPALAGVLDYLKAHAADFPAGQRMRSCEPVVAIRSLIRWASSA